MGTTAPLVRKTIGQKLNSGRLQRAVIKFEDPSSQAKINIFGLASSYKDLPSCKISAAFYAIDFDRVGAAPLDKDIPAELMAHRYACRWIKTRHEATDGYKLHTLAADYRECIGVKSVLLGEARHRNCGGELDSLRQCKLCGSNSGVLQSWDIDMVYRTNARGMEIDAGKQNDIKNINEMRQLLENENIPMVPFEIWPVWVSIAPGVEVEFDSGFINNSGLLSVVHGRIPTITPATVGVELPKVKPGTSILELRSTISATILDKITSYMRGQHTFFLHRPIWPISWLDPSVLEHVEFAAFLKPNNTTIVTPRTQLVNSAPVHRFYFSLRSKKSSRDTRLTYT